VTGVVGSIHDSRITTHGLHEGAASAISRKTRRLEGWRGHPSSLNLHPSLLFNGGKFVALVAHACAREVVSMSARSVS